MDAPSFWPDGYEDPALFEFYEEMAEMHDGAVLSTPLEELKRKGCEPPAPDKVSDEDLPEAIQNLVIDLAGINVLVESIEHLPDRQLYEHLWKELVTEPDVLFPESEDSRMHWDLLGGCSEEDMEIYMRFYANEQERADWLELTGEPLPPAELPPYPKPWFHADETWPI